MMPPDPRKGVLKVKENRVKGRLAYKSFMNFGLEVKMGLGGITSLTEAILEKREETVIFKIPKKTFVKNFLK